MLGVKLMRIGRRLMLPLTIELRRSTGPEISNESTRSSSCLTLDRLLDRTSDIRISETGHGPADARRYDYLPTYLFRGPNNLHLEFGAGAN